MFLTDMNTTIPAKFDGNFFATVWEIIKGFIFNEIFLYTIFAWASAQSLKIIITLFTEKKFRIDRIFGDGGMPSGHSATVTTLALLVGWVEGYGSAAFALAGIFAVVTMHDAMGVRREAGKHAVSIKELADAVNQLVKDEDVEVKIEKLKILVGHTPIQVYAGAFLGFVIAMIGILLGIESKWFAYPEGWINPVGWLAGLFS